MLSIDPNYRSLPEQVDFLTEKQEEQETINAEVEQFIEDQEFLNNNQEILNTSYNNRIGQVERRTTQNELDISNLNSEVEAVAGKGGYLIPYNFGTATPTEQQLNDYALSQITNIDTPEEIFNGTRVTNLYNNHTWILNNTQDTDPVVFEWVDLGQSLVSIATNSTEGVVKGSADNLKVAVAVDGTMSVNGLQTELDSLDNNKQDTLDTTNIPSGTIDEAIGFDNLGNVVRGSAGGGSQLYYHYVKLRDANISKDVYLSFINNRSEVYANITQIGSYLTLLGYYDSSVIAYPCILKDYPNVEISSNTQIIHSPVGVYAQTNSSIYIAIKNLKTETLIDFDNKTLSYSATNDFTYHLLSFVNDKVTPL